MLRAASIGGRQRRAFRTVGVELIGSADAAKADVEVILLAAESLLSLGIDDITVDINVPIAVSDIEFMLRVTTVLTHFSKDEII